MVEGPNTQPIPQIRGEIKEFLNVPGTKDGWLLKDTLHTVHLQTTDGKKILYNLGSISQKMCFTIANRLCCG